MAAPRDEKGTTATVDQPQDAPAAQPQTAAEIAETAAAIGVAPPPTPGAPPANGATVPAVRAPTAAVRMGVAPTNLDEGWRLANMIAKSELVPKGYQGRPADVLVAIQYGMEVGLPPMAALHSIYVTNGRPGLWGDGFLAVIMASPAYRDHDEYFMVDGQRKEFLTAADLAKDDTMAVSTFWRKDNARPRTATFSITKAKKAGLWSKQGPWQNYPDRMLKFRARGFAGRDAFPDVLRGIQPAEELHDTPPGDFIESEPAPIVQRISETASAPAPATPAPRTEPTAEEVTIGPIGVKSVEEFLGGFTITLSNGQQIDTTEAAEALDLEKLKGTKHRINLVCVRPPTGNLTLKSFGAAD